MVPEADRQLAAERAAADDQGPLTHEVMRTNQADGGVGRHATGDQKREHRDAGAKKGRARHAGLEGDQGKKQAQGEPGRKATGVT